MCLTKYYLNKNKPMLPIQVTIILNIPKKILKFQVTVINTIYKLNFLSYIQ